MVFDHSNYRSFLRSTLVARQERNAAYSMRAMAVQVGLSQSTLSQVLNGKKNFSVESATRIAKKLDLNDVESEYFRALVQLEATKDPDLKRSLLSRAQELNPRHEVKELSVDFFQMISDWYHLAIKNMLSLDGFGFTPATVAERLGITKLQAKAAIERLLRLEAIEPNPAQPGTYQKVQNYTVTRSHVPNEALRRFHKQMLEKAIDSLETQSPKEKIVGSETFAISEEALPQANLLVEEFFGKMIALSEKSTNKNQVYHLGVQFFNLTKGKK